MSLPVRATPNQPSSAAKKGNALPLAANARPIVESEPEYRVTVPRASMAAMVSSEYFTRFNVFKYVLKSLPKLIPNSSPEMMPVSSSAVPVADMKLRM